MTLILQGPDFKKNVYVWENETGLDLPEDGTWIADQNGMLI